LPGVSPVPRQTQPALSAAPSPSASGAIAIATPNSRPLPTPPASLPLRISAQLDPRAPRAGTDFVLRLSIANDGDRPTDGVYVATSGPWARWTVLEIGPAGEFSRDAAGWHIVAPLVIPPRQSATLELRITANEPSEEQLTFAVREAEPGELR
jgi:hypothetical protein